MRHVKYGSEWRKVDGMVQVITAQPGAVTLAAAALERAIGNALLICTKDDARRRRSPARPFRPELGSIRLEYRRRRATAEDAGLFLLATDFTRFMIERVPSQEGSTRDLVFQLERADARELQQELRNAAKAGADVVLDGSPDGMRLTVGLPTGSIGLQSRYDPTRYPDLRRLLPRNDRAPIAQAGVAFEADHLLDLGRIRTAGPKPCPRIIFRGANMPVQVEYEGGPTVFLGQVPWSATDPETG